MNSIFELGYGEYELLNLLKDLKGLTSNCFIFLYDSKINFYLRRVASKDDEIAYLYALYLDGRPHFLTREGASKDPRSSYWYALDVDKGPHPLTRTGVDKDPHWKSKYIKDIGELKR